MKKSLTSIAFALVATTALLSGCANNQQLGTGVGAVAGGVVGDAVIGGTLGTWRRGRRGRHRQPDWQNQDKNNRASVPHGRRFDPKKCRPESAFL